MTTDHKDLKPAKDAVISALAALSKASSDAAVATAGFFQALDANTETSSEIHKLASTFAVLGASVKSIDEQIPLLAAELSGKKLVMPKKKVERDPNAPKKPLTAFFAYSAHVRDKIRSDRAAKGESALSSVELTQLISQNWNSLSDLQKETWKKRYYDELVGYNKEFEKYQHDKAANGDLSSTPLIAVPAEVVTHSPTSTSEKKKSKKRKAEDDSSEVKHEKSEKKEKKKDKKDKKKK